jgi:hypothetical protein
VWQIGSAAASFALLAIVVARINHAPQLLALQSLVVFATLPTLWRVFGAQLRKRLGYF